MLTDDQKTSADQIGLAVWVLTAVFVAVGLGLALKGYAVIGLPFAAVVLAVGLGAELLIRRTVTH